MAMHNPPHPGGIVRRQCLEPLGLSVTKAAGVPRRDTAGFVRTGERQDRHFGRHVDPALQGVRVDTGDLARDADGP